MSARDAIQLFVLSAIWGASFILIRIGVAEIPPTWLVIGRLLVGSLVIGAVIIIGKRRLVPRALMGTMIVVAFFNNAMPFLFFAIAGKTVDSSISGIINATTTLFSALIAVGLRDATLNPKNLAGVALGFLGVIVAASGGLSHGHASLIGLVLLTVGSFGYALAGTIAKRSLQGQDAVGIVIAQLLLAALMLLPFAAFERPASTLTLFPILAMVTLGVFASGLAYLLSYDLLSRISPTQLSAVTYILPVWSLFWGWISGEQLGWTSLAGVGIILVAMVLLNAPPTSKQPTSSPART
jgi:drug/metabolite transporter (DMT)-like permease